MRMCVAALLTCFVLVAQTSTAQAWEPIQCSTDPSRFLSYPDTGEPWPLIPRDNIPKGTEARRALDNGIQLWNSTLGAFDALSLSKSSYKLCKPPNRSGFGVVGIDDGECADKLNFNWWGGAANGVRQYWIDDCEIVATTLYANPKEESTAAEIGDVMAHELGHHLNYAHNWFDVSVMGYGVNMYWYLTADDQSYMRNRYPSVGGAKANLHLHRTVLLTALGEEIKPNLHSQTVAPDPVCTPGPCKKLSPGHTISVMLTYANPGGEETTEPVRFVMSLGATQIGEWVIQENMPAHSYGTYEFTATVPKGVKMGEQMLRIVMDPEERIPEQPGPSSTRFRDFDGIEVVSLEKCDGCKLGGSAGPETIVFDPDQHLAKAWMDDEPMEEEPAPVLKTAGCRVAPGPTNPAWVLLVVAALLFRRRRD